MLVHDRVVTGRVQGASRTSLLPSLVEVMAPVEPQLVEADWSSVAGSIQQAAGQRCLVVLLTALEPAAVREGLLPVLPALAHRHQVVVASVADPRVAELAAGRGDVTATYAAAAAMRAAAERDHLTAELGRLGVEVVDAVPESLPPALADRYLALKAAGRL